MNDKVISLIKGYRDRARAILRAQTLNEMVATLQKLTTQQTKVATDLEANAQRQTDIVNGVYAIDIANATTKSLSPEELKAQAQAELENEATSLNETKAAVDKQLTDLHNDITLAANGGKGFAFSKSEITRVANELIANDANLKLADISDSEAQPTE